MICNLPSEQVERLYLIGTTV